MEHTGEITPRVKNKQLTCKVMPFGQTAMYHYAEDINVYHDVTGKVVMEKSMRKEARLVVEEPCKELFEKCFNSLRGSGRAKVTLEFEGGSNQYLYVMLPSVVTVTDIICVLIPKGLYK